MKKDKKVCDMTVSELEELIRRNLFVYNPPIQYFPPYIGDGLPPELRQDMDVIWSDRTIERKKNND